MFIRTKRNQLINLNNFPGCYVEDNSLKLWVDPKLTFKQGIPRNIASFDNEELAVLALNDLCAAMHSGDTLWDVNIFIANN